VTLGVDLDARIGGFTVACRFALPPGCTIAIVGKSGAGTTSVLRCVAGLVRPQRGRIVCDDAVWFDADSRTWVPPRDRDCTLVFAEHALFGHMSVLENAAFGLRASGQPKSLALSRGLEALERLGVADLRARRAGTLSSGEAQRVAIARALSLRPRVLLLDEPFANIDVERRPPVREAVRAAIAQHAMAAVLVSHDPVEAALFSDQLLVMEAGAVVQRGSPAQLRERPLTSYVAAFAGVNLYRGTATPASGGVSTVEVGASSFVIPGSVSGPVALVIDPDAVVVSHEPATSSARNALFGPIAAVVPDGASLRLSIASDPPIVARITKRSVDELGLAPGVAVHASFKASEVRVH